jgi:DNA-binding NarL/FixJ family response regulator
VILARRGRRPLHAIALHDEASILLRGGHPDTSRARARLGVALRSFRVLEMEPWVAHTHQLLDLPRPSYPDGLTSREVEILAMLADGRDVAAIASALGRPAAAAEKEIARARAKIGARSKAAAAAYAREKGLVAPAA